MLPPTRTGASGGGGGCDTPPAPALPTTTEPLPPTTVNDDVAPPGIVCVVTVRPSGRTRGFRALCATRLASAIARSSASPNVREPIELPRPRPWYETVAIALLSTNQLPFIG